MRMGRILGYDQYGLTLDQEQPLRRRGRAGGAAIGGLRAPRPARPRPGAAAHLDQRADDGADHVVEEPVGLDFQGHEVRARAPLPRSTREVEDRADAVLPRRAGGLEAAEVVRADAAAAARVHGFGVQPAVA